VGVVNCPSQENEHDIRLTSHALDKTGEQPYELQSTNEDVNKEFFQRVNLSHLDTRESDE
jgi:hypothetical protein